MVSEEDRVFLFLLATCDIEIKYLKDKNKLVRIITNSRIEKYIIYFFCPGCRSKENVVFGIYSLY